MKNKTTLRYDSIYRWGVGYRSHELAERWEILKEDYCIQMNIELFNDELFGRMHTENWEENGVYFHPQGTFFSGQYNSDKYLNKFKEMMANEFNEQPQIITHS